MFGEKKITRNTHNHNAEVKRDTSLDMFGTMEKWRRLSHD